MFRRKRADTRVGSLRKLYGDDFARGFRRDAQLGTVLREEGADSLSELLRGKRGKMANNKKIFISFAIEDKFARDNLVYQAKQQDNAPFDFTDMSVKQPWDSQWKTNCRTKIKGCDGVIAFISRKTKNADGACWEIKCAKEGKRKESRSRAFGFTAMTRAASRTSLEARALCIGLGTTSRISLILSEQMAGSYEKSSCCRHQ